MKSRFEKARKWLLFWTLFIGIGAVGGSACMLFDPSGKLLGMDAMLPFFKKLPLADILFADFTFSGYALLIVNGLTNLTAAGLLLGRRYAGAVCGCVFGVTLMLWICIQFYMFPFNFMSTAYFIFGLIQAITGYAACVFYRQELFAKNEHAYPRVGKGGHKKLVVYFFAHGLCKEAGDGGGQRHRRGRVRGALDRAYSGRAGLLVVRTVRYAPLGYAYRRYIDKTKLISPCNDMHTDMGIQSGRAHAHVLPQGARTDTRGRLHTGAPHQFAVRQRSARNE